jgi:hypothetical protein
VERVARELEPRDVVGGASARFLPFALLTFGGGELGTTIGLGGSAYSCVHWRAVVSCSRRLRVYWVAIEGTVMSAGIGYMEDWMEWGE